VSLAVLVSVAPPAVAGLSNAIPANASGDPTESFTDDEAVFAYVLSDIKGGEVCIVAGTFSEPSGLDCSAEAWGGKNTVVGIGTQFVPIAAPPLKPGTWRLLTTDSEGGSPKLSQPFTVSPCSLGQCDYTIASGILADYKAAAERNLIGAAATCLTFAAKSINGVLTKARGRAKTLDATEKDYATGGGFAALVVGGAGFGLSFVSIPSLANPGEEKALEILKDLTCTLTSMYSDIVADPPDPAYSTVAAPVYSTIPALADPAQDIFAGTVDRQRGLGVAALRALERYQAALADGATAYIHAQAAAIDRFTTEQIDEIRRTAAAARAYNVVLNADPDFSSPAATAQERTELISIYERIRTSGFTQDELDQLQSLGYTQAEIDVIRSHFDIDPTRLPADQTVQRVLEDFASTLEASISSFDLLARNAASVAGRSNAPPLSSFTATPSSGDPLQVNFVDTSTSADLDPIISVSWNFGDGQTGEGASTSHAYSTEGFFTVVETVCDYLECAPATKEISVGAGGGNQPPVAVDDTLTTEQDTAGTVNVLANDSDPDPGDALTVTDSTAGAHGTVSCQPAGDCTYTPAAGYSGPDSFTYTVSDGNGGTATGNVSVTVTPTGGGNQPPVAVDDTLTTDRNLSKSVDVLMNDSDPDGDTLTIETWTSPAHGFVSCDFVNSCTYFPNTDYTGGDSFTYTISDGRGGTATGTVSVTVNDVNHPPVAVDDVLTTPRDTYAFVNPLANDTDADSDQLTLESATPPQHGTSSCAPYGGCSYFPDAGFFGADSFTYIVSDGHGGSDEGTVSITVERNRAPTPNSDTLGVSTNTSNSVNVLENDTDPDGDPLTVTGGTDGAYGNVSCTAAGVCTYSPNTGFKGADQFTYTVSDGNGGTATGYVAVTVADLLEAGSDWVWRKDRLLEFTITAIDPTGATHTCSWSFGDGSLAGTDCSFAHTYQATGSFDATVAVDFSNGQSATDTVHIDVIPPEDSGGGGGGTGNGITVVGTDVTYTSDADFDQGTLLNVNHDPPNGDQLQLNERTTPFPFVNIAASSRGTIVRIDVSTGDVVGEYLTSPEGMGRSPSRTTVDQLGNVWVANRDEFSAAGGRPRGSVARAGLVIGGDRVDANGNPNPNGGFLAPPFQYNTCVDRDGDGLLHTSKGLGDILPWTNDGGADTGGGVSTAADECVITYTRVTGTGTRTLAVDSNNDLWVGGTGNQEFEKLDGATDQPIAGTQFNLGCGGYGGLLDGHGVLWGAAPTLRYDTSAATGECLFSIPSYGLGVDPQTGHVWSSSGSSVYEVDADGTLRATYDNGGFGSQGIAVDGTGNVWVAHGLGGQSVGRVRTDGTLVGVVPTHFGPTGVAVDANGKVWVANLGADDAQRIDPQIGRVGLTGDPAGWVDMTVSLGAGAGPYNYSDMTGFVSIGATAQSGFWRIVQDSGGAGRAWQSISWNATAPSGTELIVEARAADTQAALAALEFAQVANGGPLALTGRLIEVRATLRTTSTDRTPVLSDIRIQAESTTVGKSTSTTYTGLASVQYSDPAALSGRLVDTSVSPSVPVAGKRLDFALGTQTGSASPTDASGAASTSLVITQQPGSVTSIETSFAGDSSYLASNDSDPFAITKENCTLTYSGDTLVTPVANTTLAADLGEPDASLGDRSNKSVTFRAIDAALNTLTFTATTNASGHASTSVALPDGVYGVSVSFTGDDFYLPCQTPTDTLVTVQAAAAKVTGGGWISIGSSRTSFGFNAIPQAGGSFKGQFQLRSKNGKNRFHGNVVSGLSSSGNAATWSGTGVWNGKPNHTFTISVVDNGTGKSDKITITIKSPSNATVYSTNGSQTLKGGNITVH
jgi:streptogramin lyase